jgi:hypothetical protein
MHAIDRRGRHPRKRINELAPPDTSCQTVAAEAREVHQVDILDVETSAQALDQTAECGGLVSRGGIGHHQQISSSSS